MIPKGLFMQIAIVATSIAIIITYIQPAFAEIGELQDDIEVYQKEQDKVVSVNSRLAELQSKLESVSNDDKRRLLTYMPDEVDSIGVTRDLYLITQEAGVLYKDATYSGEPKRQQGGANSSEEEGVQSKPHTFSLSVEGSYEQLKELFRLMERNNYPLEIQDLKITELEGDFLAATLEITTYTYRPLTSESEQITF